MNKDEYIIEKNKLIESFGKPEYDFDRSALNESAKRLYKLQADYRASLKIEKNRQAKQAGQKQETEVKDLVTSEIKQKYRGVSLPVIQINDNDLLPFTDKERAVLMLHFENMNLTHGELAVRVKDCSRQAVTALLDSPAYRILEAKVFDKLMPTETRIALLQAVRGGDSKITQRMAEHYKILNPEKMEIDLNKPIEDAEAMKMLKEIGDKLVDGETKKL